MMFFTGEHPAFVVARNIRSNIALLDYGKDAEAKTPSPGKTSTTGQDTMAYPEQNS
jgi:hypothetical protein